MRVLSRLDLALSRLHKGAEPALLMFPRVLENDIFDVDVKQAVGLSLLACRSHNG